MAARKPSRPGSGRPPRKPSRKPPRKPARPTSGRRGPEPRGKPARTQAPGRRPPRRPKSRPPIRVEPLPGAAPLEPGIRLNRFLAASGVCSRRAADSYITGGRVAVNGRVIRELGTRIDPEQDEVRCDGVRVRPEKPVYVLFNKPKDVVCTNARYEQRRRVVDFMPEVRGRIYTIGRLDAESEGLILLTNDGDFAQAIAHPSHEVPKTYAVLIRGRLTPEHLTKARGGVWLAEGRTGGMQLRIERQGGDRTFLHVTLREGRNREIRRVFGKLGYPVTALKRIRIGKLTLHGLGVGKWRFLTPDEVESLRTLAQTGE